MSAIDLADATVSPETPNAVALQRIFARCAEAGDCWIWQTEAKDRMPKINIQGRPVSVRRLVYEHYHGPLREGMEVKAVCGCHWCVSPNCSKAFTRMQSARFEAKRGTYSRPSMAKKAAARRRSNLTMEIAEAMRASPLSLREAAEHWGCDKKVVWLIRANRAWTNASPFAGLGGRR